MHNENCKSAQIKSNLIILTCAINLMATVRLKLQLHLARCKTQTIAYYYQYVSQQYHLFQMLDDIVFDCIKFDYHCDCNCKQKHETHNNNELSHNFTIAVSRCISCSFRTVAIEIRCRCSVGVYQCSQQLYNLRSRSECRTNWLEAWIDLSTMLFAHKQIWCICFSLVQIAQTAVTPKFHFSSVALQNLLLGHEIYAVEKNASLYFYVKCIFSYLLF